MKVTETRETRETTVDEEPLPEDATVHPAPKTDEPEPGDTEEGNPG